MPVYTYTTIDDPLATANTHANGINDNGQIVGSYTNNSGGHGFLLSGGTYTTLDGPIFVGGNSAQGINASGQIVGSYQDVSGTHGYLNSGRLYAPIDLANLFFLANMLLPLRVVSTLRARSSDFTQ